MFGIIKWIIVNILNMLPDSPFSTMLDQMEIDASYMQYMNWFLPLDNIGIIMLAWIDCIGLYFVFLLIKWIVFKVVIGKIQEIMGAAAMIGGA